MDGLTPPSDSSLHQTEAYPRLRGALRGLRQDSGLPEKIAAYREWVPRFSRYSFETVHIPWEDSPAPWRSLSGQPDLTKVTMPPDPEIEATGALAPRVLVQRFCDATLGGRSFGLGIVDCRFGQLRDPFGGCDCV